MNKMLSKAWEILTTIVVLLAFMLAVLLVGVRLAGLKPFAVMSGSMEPAYPVGALIYIKDAEPAEIRVGDPITYVMNAEQLVSTHRVVKIDVVHTVQKPVTDDLGCPVQGDDGNPLYEDVPLVESAYYFTTKGDANPVQDATPVSGENVLGVPVFCVPYLGYVSTWLQTPNGRVLGCAAAIAILILLFLPEMIGKGEQRLTRTQTQGTKEHTEQS